ncbi:hypothetical protein ACIBIZ_31845 [Nonomuraea spiralis]|uniref:Uncharacterized protein n=1 Tax=Nonomuraea spiralis TaxID=46182 RepID=A0ABV5IJM5_9ACTN|nr:MULTISPECIES: hypothetical protein [Nonomuraea]RSN05708.1 hypothetical protein DMB42_27605 [Nonomuraea sp. WAC 01424]GGT07767.1 hypothetical protein GCM10010176_060100 [Nonomuraea spiralis]
MTATTTVTVRVRIAIAILLAALAGFAAIAAVPHPAHAVPAAGDHGTVNGTMDWPWGLIEGAFQD